MRAGTHGVAVVGLGTVGMRYVEQFTHHDRFEVIGGFDTSSVATRDAAQAGTRIAEDPAALIADPDVDIVYVAVPPRHHRHYVDQVLDAGKAVLCEKPLGVEEADSVAMAERVSGSGARAAINFVYGAAPAARALSDQFRSAGREAHSAEIRLHFGRWPRQWQSGAGWLRDRDQGGWTREVLSHFVFLVNRLLGPAQVQCSEVTFPSDGTSEQQMVAQLRCGRVPVAITATSDSAGPDEVVFTVRGPHKAWRLDNWYTLSAAEGFDDWKPALAPEQAGGPAAYRAQLDQLEALVTGRPNTLATFAEALSVQRVVETLIKG